MRIRFILIILFSLLVTPLYAANPISSCQNLNILDYLSSSEGASITPISADIDGDSLKDTIMLNIRNGWLVLDFYVDNDLSKNCEPVVSLKYLNIDGTDEPAWYPAEWFPTIKINKSGSIVFALNSFCKDNMCSHGGIPFVDYIYTFRFLPNQKIQLIGYDNWPRNVQTGSALKISINFLNGKVIEQKVCDFVSDCGIIEENIFTQEFPYFVFENNAKMVTPVELEKFLDARYEDFFNKKYSE